MNKFLLLVMFICTSLLNAVSIHNVVWKDPVGVSINGNNLTRTFTSNAWNADAVSTDTIDAGFDGFVESTAQEINTYRMFGFSDVNVNSSYSSIDYALYLHASARVKVYENGSYKGDFSNYITGDVFRVSRIGTAITYSQNGVVFYTSLTASSSELLVDTSLYSPNATLKNVVMGTIPEPVSSVLIAFGLVFFIYLKKK